MEMYHTLYSPHLLVPTLINQPQMDGTVQSQFNYSAGFTNQFSSSDSVLQLVGVDVQPLRSHRGFQAHRTITPRNVVSFHHASHFFGHDDHRSPVHHQHLEKGHYWGPGKNNYRNHRRGRGGVHRGQSQNGGNSDAEYSSDSGFSSRSPTPNNKYQPRCEKSPDSSDYPQNISASGETECSGSPHQESNKGVKALAHRGRRNGYPALLFPGPNLSLPFLTPPDKFLVRASLVEVTASPSDLLNGSVWDKLSEPIWNKFLENQQTEATFRKKMLLWKDLYLYIRDCYPRYGLYLVGSTMNGFGSDSSDVDMCLLVRRSEMDQRNEAVGHLELIQRHLGKCAFVHRSELIQAKVPILKFRDSFRNLEVDLNCNNSVGIRNTHLLHCYSQIDWRVRPLVLIVKLWAQSQNINDAKNMTISSYSLVLMIIHYLQCGVQPPILPCLSVLYPGKFSPVIDLQKIDLHEQLGPFPCENNQTLGELLLGFLNYYANQFNYALNAVSVRLGTKVPIEDCRRARSYKNDPHQWKYLCIEEPFDLTNTARSVYDHSVFERVKDVFQQSWAKLSMTQDVDSIFAKEKE